VAETFLPLRNTESNSDYLNDVLAGFTVDYVELDLDEYGPTRSIVIHLNDGRSVMVATPSEEGLLIAEAGLGEG
jgi:hypothetical protein